MSEFNKPENQQPDLKCPFDPDQYKIKVRAVAAPAGSFPWAIIQVYLGNHVNRDGWEASNEYIRLASGLVNFSPQIEKTNENGECSIWQPTQEDMMACDWKFHCMLSFDLKLGTSKFNYGQDWGYISDKEGYLNTGESTFGTLNITSNKTDIANILAFYWGTSDWLHLIVSSKESHEKIAGLLTKNIYVTVDDTIYNLGATSLSSGDNTNGTYTVEYGNNDARKLGEVLKQTNKTKTFCINWS
ncbi:hypothetical protein Xvie_02125 [Xenorhabdus vietnamensis]|uniref:Uncharacterized protein n=1 Tax=Xenorhabdus vietnamensis TaxID=351656 RepID=A0A1Y2SDP1_9GAMM|nr:MW1434 family type I TA system toxin [Xenorhabdus vietnamensis]OTA16085.1 hypothetical protein Xvie_02125 [Xenorhabdus vietnamensis]